MKGGVFVQDRLRQSRERMTVTPKEQQQRITAYRNVKREGRRKLGRKEKSVVEWKGREVREQSK